MPRDERRTVKVRVAVCVDREGDWAASGWPVETAAAGEEVMRVAGEGLLAGEARYWLEAELPVPDHTTQTISDVRITREEP